MEACALKLFSIKKTDAYFSFVQWHGIQDYQESLTQARYIKLPLQALPILQVFPILHA